MKLSRIDLQAGFQLMEVVIFVLILSCVIGLTMGPLQDVIDWHRLKSAGELMVEELSNARSEAICRNIPIQVRIDPGASQIGFAEPGSTPRLWRELPAEVRVVGAPARPVTFYSRGIAVPAGTYILANRKGQVRTVVAAGGRIRWQITQ